jgi:hypothetical protein
VSIGRRDVACPTKCGTETYPFLGDLAAHLREAHGMDNDPAVQRARDEFTKAAPVSRPSTWTDPCGLSANGITTHEPPTVPSPPSKEPAMPPKPHAADPTACTLCTRFAPEKCKRHGGRSRSTSHGENRKGRTAAPDPALAKIDEVIAARRAVLERVTGEINALLIAREVLA